ncbi:uncharacterized protein [Asterias amurensis]|uniref:uncharacterized protein n=1 Tax=Asterias amurensis TaxID=7602 RepID=UPI003AB173ED
MRSNMKGVAVFVALLACSFLELTTGREVGHYKGGSITWKADDDNPNHIQIFVRMNFRHEYSNGYLHEACTNEAIEERTELSTEGSFRVDDERISWAKYICTDYDETMDWSAGYYLLSYNMAPGQTMAEFNFQECCWPTNVANNGNDQGNGRGWNMVSTIDITSRPDTGRPNSPPVSGSFPVYRMYRGCKYSRYIKAWDADGDDLRCRWTDAARNECNADDGDVCGELFVDSKRRKSGALLEEDTCKITFNKRNPAGTYAVAVMVEDYAPSDPTTPLSKIPVQFLIEVVDRDGKCRKPELLGEDGTCITIPTGREYSTPIKARSSEPGAFITSFETIKPSGVHASPIRKVEGTDDEYSVTLSWTPTSDQIGRHVICYEAEEGYKYSSDMACFYVNVVDASNYTPQLAVLPSESSPSPGATLRGDSIQVTYTGQIHKSSQSVLISIMDASNTPVFQIASSSDGVLVSGTTLSFNLPHDVPLQRGDMYTIRVDEGAVRSAGDCEAAPSAAEWDFIFESFCDGDYRPLAVVLEDSVPAIGAEMKGNVVSVTYNKKIQKPADSAFVTIFNSANSPVFRVDTSTPDVTIDSRTLSFELPLTLPLEFQGTYRMRVDEGAAVSVRDCDQGLAPMVEWDFVFVTFCTEDEEYEPLTVLPTESLPSPGEDFAGQTIMIRYNKQIQQPADTAYITLYDEFDIPFLQVDASTPEVSVSGNTLSFSLSTSLPFQFGGGYKIRVDEGAVMSAQDCDLVAPPMAEWEFGFITFCDFDGEFEPLDVLPMESTPAPGESLTGRVVTISYNKEIKKPMRPAYISVRDTFDSLLYQVDVTSPYVTIVGGSSLSFTLPLTLPLQFEDTYKIRVDEWAVVSAQDCDLSRPETAEWRFTFLTFCQDGGDGFEPLVVVPLDSLPQPGGNISGHEIRIQYSKPIQKATSSAYVTIVNSDETDLYRVDTSSPDVTVDGSSMLFSLPVAAAIFYGADYRIRVDEGAVKSAQECDLAQPAGEEWGFKWTGRRLPGNLDDKDLDKVTPTGNADCRENFMQTFVSKRLVGDIDPTTMYLNDRSCTGRDFNKTHYVIGTSYDACKTTSEATRSGGFLDFENVVYIPPKPYTPGSEITRNHFIEIHLSCRVAADKVGYLSFDPNVTTIVYYEKGYGNFNFSLRMYEDESYSKAYNLKEFPVGVQLKQRMHFEGRVTCDGNCDLMIDSCWATPTTNPFDAIRFPFITNGCPIDDTVRLLTPPSRRKERFAIDSFAFLGDNIHGLVYVHCDMRICDASDPNSKCAMGCDAGSQTPSPDDVIPPNRPIRGDTPLSGTRSRLVRKRDVSQVGSSSDAYPSTGGLLRMVNDQTAVHVHGRGSPIDVDADVIEVTMLGIIMLLLVMLVVMQCGRTYSGKEVKEFVNGV